jgi:hypothetical protein
MMSIGLLNILGKVSTASLFLSPLGGGGAGYNEEREIGEALLAMTKAGHSLEDIIAATAKEQGITEDYNKWLDLNFGDTDWESMTKYMTMAHSLAKRYDEDSQATLSGVDQLFGGPRLVQGSLESPESPVSSIAPDLLARFNKEFGELTAYRQQELMDKSDMQLKYLANVITSSEFGRTADPQMTDVIDILLLIAKGTNTTIPQAFADATTGVE